MNQSNSLELGKKESLFLDTRKRWGRYFLMLSTALLVSTVLVFIWTWFIAFKSNLLPSTAPVTNHGPWVGHRGLCTGVEFMVMLPLFSAISSLFSRIFYPTKGVWLFFLSSLSLSFLSLIFHYNLVTD